MPDFALSLSRRVGRWLPHGQTLPEDAWRVRHRAVTVLLLLHVVVIGLVGLIAGREVNDVLGDAAVPGLGAFAASRTSLSRGVRSGIGSVALMLTSAVVVHLMNGSIEGHFHFFAMIPVVALYESWVPFGLAVTVVLLHHGLMGTVDPSAVYDHASAIRHPWRWAFVHAGFFASACVGALVNWRLHEHARREQEVLTSHVQHQAHHDMLTGLPNRTALLEHAQQALAAGQDRAAVLLIDLDRFKEVNDVLGHASGDALLARVGPVMASAVRDGDMLCRLGGDEFAAVLCGADEATATAVAARLLDLISVTWQIEGVALNVEASIGIAVSTPETPADIDTLLSHADIAMYCAKRARCGFTVFHPEQATTTIERLNLVGEMRQALVRNEFVLHYQPKVAVSDGRLIGVEALARWQHPVRGLLAPGEFIPAAEATGLIVPFTLYVLRLALSQAPVWRAPDESLTLAVNLSPRCLAEPDLTGRVLALLHEFDLPPSVLELEITEDTLAHDPDRALATLTALHNAGIAISIDDFGTGYSSMSYLKRLPVRELKVDRSFVSTMLSDLDDGVLVRSVIDLAHNLGLTVVAEGVEDQATFDALAEIGCDVAQGYHCGRPMPVEALLAWRAAQPQLHPVQQ